MSDRDNVLSVIGFRASRANIALREYGVKTYKELCAKLKLGYANGISPDRVKIQLTVYGESRAVEQLRELVEGKREDVDRDNYFVIDVEEVKSIYGKGYRTNIESVCKSFGVQCLHIFPVGNTRFDLVAISGEPDNIQELKLSLEETLE